MIRLFFCLYCLITTNLCLSLDLDLKVNWSFLEVQEGVDYPSKVQITIDGKLVHESSEFKETSSNATTSCKVKPGKHVVSVQAFTLYEGVWEAKTKSNDYSVDAFYNGEVVIKKNATLTLIFDIGLEKSLFYWEGLVTKKESKISTSITWQYISVENGYDYDSKLFIEVDGQLLTSSSILKLSSLGNLTVFIPKGSHNISIKSYIRFGDVWQVHTIENGYSFDAVYNQQLDFKGKSKKIDLKFDLDSGTTIPTVK